MSTLMLNAKQAAAKLGIAKGTLSKLYIDGKIVGVESGNGKKRKYILFSEKALNDFRKANPEYRRASPRKPTSKFILTNNQETSSTPLMLLTRLERIESKLDKLIAMWS